MSQLKKYTNFKALKSDVKTDKPAASKDNKSLLEFESFLHLIQQQFSTKNHIKLTNGK